MAGAFKRAHQDKPGGRWTASYIDEHGTRRYKVGYTDKAKTLELARRLEDEARQIRDGLIDPRKQAAREAGRKALSDHIEAYGAYLRDKGTTAKHAQQAPSAIRRLVESTGAKRLADLKPDRLQGAVARLKAATSARTANYALTHLKSWIRWLEATNRLAELPRWLGMLKPFNEATDRKRIRRALTPGEIEALLSGTSHPLYPPDDVVTRRGPRGEKHDPANLRIMSRLDRYWLYRLALETGLRASELGSLTRESFDLKAKTVTVEAAFSKHRREDVIPLRGETAQVIHRWIKTKPEGQPVFPMPLAAGKMLARDLEAACIPVKTAEGVIDFHSLRHTFISRLVERGTDLKTTMDLSRHSTPNLTARYSHTTDERRRAAIEGSGDASAGVSSQDEHQRTRTETGERETG